MDFVIINTAKYIYFLVLFPKRKLLRSEGSFSLSPAGQLTGDRQGEVFLCGVLHLTTRGGGTK